MASAEGNAPIIVRKKVKKAAEGHHGGAWKVAYADFVTAMMAFFLLMWLLNATTEKQRKGLADYFDPSIPISPVSAGGESVLSGDSAMVEDNKAGSREEGRRPGEADPEIAEAARGGAARGETGAAEQARLERLAGQMTQAMQAAGGELGRHFQLRVTPEGLVLEIVDRDGAPLFDSGSAEAGPRLTRLIGVVGPVIGRTANPVKVVGHTDATRFARPRYDNWGLSADRANTARRLLSGAGVAPERIAEVAGRADTQPLVDDPLAPQNRRIAITLLREGR
mgnify:FL=1